MIVHGFDMHRVYISAPGDLEAEKQLCRSAIAELNDSTAMPAKVLLVSVALPQEGMIENFRSAVSDNVRQCGYFVQIFEDSWGPKNLARKMFHLACDSRSDDTLPMKEVAVFLKDAPRETDPEILAFRKEIVDLSDVNVYYFKTSEEMRAQLRQVAEGWLGRILADPAAGASSAAASSV